MNQPIDDVLDSLSDGFLVIDREYTIIYANERVAAFYGRPFEGIIGEKCHAVFRASSTPCEQGALCAHQEIFTKGQPVTLKRHHLLPDGSTRILEIAATPLKDAKGAIDRFVEIWRDITTEEKLRQELADSNATLELIFNNTPIISSFVDTEMRTIRLNSTMEAQVGMKSEEVRGKHCYDCWGQHAHDDSRRGRERICDGCEVPSVLLDGKTYSHEKRFGDRMFEVVSTPVRDAGGAIIGAMKQGFDITERKRVEEYLRTMGERLDTLLSFTPAVIYSCKVSGDFGATFVSANVKKQMGYEPYEFIEDPGFWAEHIHPEDRKRVIAELAHLFETGHHKHEYRFRHRDGLYRWMYDECKLILDSSLIPVEIAGYWIDITERHNAQLALQQSEQRFRTILDSATDAIFLTDCNARIIEVNRRATLSLGYGREELLRLGIGDIDPDFSLQRHRRIIWEELGPGETITIERRHRRKDGSFVPVEIHIGKMIVDEHPAMLNLVRDISERKRVEQALRERENGYRALFENSPNILCVADFSGIRQFLADLAPGCAGDQEAFFRENPRELGACLSRLRLSHVNQAALNLFGASSQLELIQGLFKVIGPEAVPQTAGGVAAMGRGETSFEHEIVLRHLLTGAPIYCILRWNVVPGCEDSYQRVILSLTDISARKSAEDKLADHRTQLRRLSARLVETEEAERRRIARELHDKLGQQLTALGLNLNIFEQELPPEQARAQHKRIVDMLLLIEEMTEQVRDIMADLRPPVLDDYGLAAALRWYGGVFGKRSGIPCTVKGADIPRLPAPVEIALFRVVQEALNNVAKHSRASRVELRITLDGDRLSLTVHDNGKGFPEADDSDMPDTLKLGLISMGERVASIGGNLTVTSASGAGTTVSVEVGL